MSKMKYFIGIMLVFCVLYVVSIQPGSREVGLQTDSSERIFAEMNKLVFSAISPLLTVCYYGIKKNMNAAEHDVLPFYAKKEFLIFEIVLLVLLLSKDTIGGILGPLKKPLDAMDVLQNKFIALFCVLGVVPELAEVLKVPGGLLIASVVRDVSFVSNAYASFVDVPNVNFEAVAWWVSYVIGVVLFYVVWSVSHALNVLCLLSPIPFVGGLLKIFRTGTLFVIASVSMVNLWLGFALCCIVLFVSFKLTKWATRMLLFGCVTVLDLFQRRWRKNFDGNNICAFTGCKIEKLPKRVFGRVRIGENLEFTYKPYHVFPEKKIIVDKNALNISLQKSLLCPAIVNCHGESMSPIFILPPRFKSHEHELGKLFDVPVVDGRLARGLAVAVRWVKEQLSAKSFPIANDSRA